MKKQTCLPKSQILSVNALTMGVTQVCLYSLFQVITHKPHLNCLVCKKGKFLCSAVSSPQDCSKCFLQFTSLTVTDLFTQILSQLLWEASSHMLQLMCEGCSYTYPPLSIARYSFIQLSELEQFRVKNMPNVLTPQHRIRTRVLLVESPKLYP